MRLSTLPETLIVLVWTLPETLIVLVSREPAELYFGSLVVEDKEDVVRDSEGEKNICNGISSCTEEVKTTTINMGSQNDMISSRELQDFKAEVTQEIAKLIRGFIYKVNQKNVSVFDSSVMLGTKSVDNIGKCDFIYVIYFMWF